jgi:UDP-N-acetylmuramate--alanine ligase
MTGKAHLVGIGGVGMSALAVLLRNRGWNVSGCDISRSPRTDWLEGLGIQFSVGHSPSHVEGSDLVVATPAVSADSPELAAAKCPVRHRGDVLAELVNSAADSVAVCGSHGKTTTSTFVARLLLALGEEVEWAIGGETGDFPVGGPDRPASGRSVLVVEADESDGTLARYRAKMLVVTNCEYDHPDHFKTPDDYFACFDAARRAADDVVESESLGPLAFLEGVGAFAALAPHNRKNARAAVEVALRRGHTPEAIAAALPAAVESLPDRRFEKIAEGVYTDYAHHPTEMRCAVSMARQVCRGKLRVLFQPHRYSRTKALLADFPASFAGADEVVLCPVYAAFERPVEGGDIADLYKAVRESPASGGAKAFLARSCEEAWEHARNSMAEGDVTLLLGAGDIVRLVPQVRRDVEEGRLGAKGPARKIFIGQGTNTVKSDLNLSVEYVKTSGPAGESGASLVAKRPGLCPWMAGIPGTVGGWVKMNAGAFGHSISEVVEAVKVDGRWLPGSECGFGYRTSAITGEIQDVRWRDAECAEGDAASFLARRKKFPPGTKGSVFKNPEGDFAGRLLEAAGAKDMRVGGAYVWEEHANVIVSGPGATSSDFLALARLMRLKVLFRFGVSLEPEVRLW